MYLAHHLMAFKVNFLCVHWNTIVNVLLSASFTTLAVIACRLFPAMGFSALVLVVFGNVFSCLDLVKVSYFDDVFLQCNFRHFHYLFLHYLCIPSTVPLISVLPVLFQCCTYSALPVCTSIKGVSASQKNNTKK